VAVFHALAPPPSGGGNQFIRALVGELRRRGLKVELNRISSRTRACLFNSYNFDADRLRRLRPGDCRMVHRVDGPIAAYRGFDDGADARIASVNAELADATILQSRYSAEESRTRGLAFRSPEIVPNAVDPRIFHPERSPRPLGRKVRLISTSWSPNPRKGGPTYRWLAENLDRSRFEYTFVGQTSEPLPGVRTIPPLPSDELASVLREHDVFVTASLDDPCSNALLEALASGLPALYVESGGHGELVGEGGVGFADVDELLPALERLMDEYDERRARIVVPSLSDVADRYLEILGVTA
jgi:glycosyltransferase involved in cell wall biosynthesis